MKKLLSLIASAVIAVSSVIGVCAVDVADVDLAVSDARDAKVDGGNRQQSCEFEYKVFDASRMTEDSEVIVSYEVVDAADSKKDENKVELVAQKYEDDKDAKKAWAIVNAVSDDGKQATFKYADIKESFKSQSGSDNMALIDKLFVEAASNATIKCTGVKVTKCVPDGKHAKDGKVSMIWVIVGIVAGAAIVITVVMIILNKKSEETFDVSTGEFVSKKKIK